ncbi:hypothetical protein ETAA8_43320 [Anatilimnocola aggregata]|uniref:Uncharacterized protein n=1 Tax=Anatilimnocola aggregata TaxID=2528021 RepID=A0A517YG65_9BACT|nr:hypothetical protein ETAA8_43320 [Anatilimnocola aggregata]
MFRSEVLGAFALLALLLTFALAREIRLRRALQRLLVRMFKPRRTNHESTTDPARDESAALDERL